MWGKMCKEIFQCCLVWAFRCASIWSRICIFLCNVLNEYLGNKVLVLKSFASGFRVKLKFSVINFGFWMFTWCLYRLLKHFYLMIHTRFVTDFYYDLASFVFEMKLNKSQVSDDNIHCMTSNSRRKRLFEFTDFISNRFWLIKILH